MKEKAYEVFFSNGESEKVFATDEGRAKLIASIKQKAKVDHNTFWLNGVVKIKELDYLHWRYR